MDSKTVIAYILILVIIFLTPFYYNYFFESPEPPPADTVSVAQDTVAPQPTQDTLTRPQQELTEPALQAQEPREEELSVAPERIDTLIVETSRFWIGLTNIGGGTIYSVKLKNYHGPDGSPYVELIPSYARHVLGFSTTGFEGQTVDYQNQPFRIINLNEFNSSDTVQISQPTPVKFEYTTSEGGTLTRTLTFFPDRYHIGLTVTLHQFQDIIANRQYELFWNSGMAITEGNATDDLNYSKAYSLLGDDLVDIDASKAKPGNPATESFEGTTRWVAVRNKYFTSIITPVSRNAIGMHLSGTLLSREDYDLKRYNANLIMPYQETAVQQDSFFVYIGPLDYDVLTDYSRHFERMMNFGWTIIRPISKAVLWAFTTMHNYIPNYGLVLILFGVVVKILVFPLTKKSYVSMKSMQTLQPKIQELRDKYKDDSQKMNQEMMKLYKEHGVNPMGGCLPMLLQMPLLYALFIVFRSTIELRGAEFILWIKDLSQPDTVFTLPFSLPLYGAQVNILPLIMAVTMILQQRVSATGTGSQQQKMMMWFMPILFLLIFNNFPSGLNLYYALFNIMTIIQQKWFIDIPTGTAQE
ncbi:MAG TPA: membrane protein insertase YidC [bacterium]|nr:membrane protein insertase YidC [bacterium]